MMNNPWFRVAVHNDGSDKLKFEHPTLAGVAGGGWMSRMKEEGLDPLNPVFATSPSRQPATPQTVAKAAEVKMTKAGVDRQITMEELEAHNKESEPWFVVKGEVYDGTGFLNQHPGGAESITLVAGEDATEEFMAIHSSDAKAQVSSLQFGKDLLTWQKAGSLPYRDACRFKKHVRTEGSSGRRDWRLFAPENVENGQVDRNPESVSRLSSSALRSARRRTAFRTPNWPALLHAVASEGVWSLRCRGRAGPTSLHPGFFPKQGHCRLSDQDLLAN
jgi:cytochrome b involved in lipid metabolism